MRKPFCELFCLLYHVYRTPTLTWSLALKLPWGGGGGVEHVYLNKNNDLLGHTQFGINTAAKC